MIRRAGLVPLTLLLLVSLVSGGAAQAPRSLSELAAAARSGETSAKTELGLRHMNGDGTLQDHAQAAHWFAQAAQEGDSRAQNALGRLLFTGLGGQQDIPGALRWLGVAAENGDADYVFDLASALETTGDAANLTRAAQLYALAAKENHLPAIVSLGVMYQGGHGVAQDFSEALRLYEIGVEAGHPRAQNNLGLLYVRGNGVEQDYARAAELFAAAAGQGLRPAMSNLGVLYENGFGVAMDTTRADELYRMAGSGRSAERAAENGFIYDPRLAAPAATEAELEALQKAARADDPVALFQVGWLLVSKPEPAFSDWGAAYDQFKKAAERGHGPSMANLSLMYFKGLGAPQDFVQGHMWMLMAKRAGTLTPTLDQLFSQTATTEQVNEAQRRASAMLDELGAEISP